jgi:hypothetical protein
MPGALLALVLVAFGCIALLLGFSRWLAHRHWAAAGNVAIGVLLFGVAQAYWPVASNLESYARLHQRPTLVAQLHCERTGPGEFRLTLTHLPGGRMQVYQVNGDQWRLEARTLIWKGPAAQIGVQPAYRLERLSARYLRARRPAELPANDPLPPPDSFDLAEADEIGADVWARARTSQGWTEQVEPGRVYGPWRPLVDAARFDVWLGHGGDLAARMDVTAANEAGAKAMR